MRSHQRSRPSAAAVDNELPHAAGGCVDDGTGAGNGGRGHRGPGQLVVPPENAAVGIVSILFRVTRPPATPSEVVPTDAWWSRVDAAGQVAVDDVQDRHAAGSHVDDGVAAGNGGHVHRRAGQAGRAAQRVKVGIVPALMLAMPLPKTLTGLFTFPPLVLLRVPETLSVSPAMLAALPSSKSAPLGTLTAPPPDHAPLAAENAAAGMRSCRCWSGPAVDRTAAGQEGAVQVDDLVHVHDAVEGQLGPS